MIRSADSAWDGATFRTWWLAGARVEIGHWMLIEADAAETHGQAVRPAVGIGGLRPADDQDAAMLREPDDRVEVRAA